MWILLWSFVFIVLASFSLFIFFLKRKIWILEKKIISLFLARTNLIPWIFEVSKDVLIKHNDIFREILALRKLEFTEKENNVEFYQFIETESKVHHELNFIFKICNKHPHLLQDGRFIYLRDLLIDRSMNISENIILYKSISKKINRFISLSRFGLIWLLIPFKEINEI